MTSDQFNLLAPRAQTTVALLRGTMLCRRPTAAGNLTLYHLANEGRGFFIELSYDQAQGRMIVLRTFTSCAPLDAYLAEMWMEWDED